MGHISPSSQNLDIVAIEIPIYSRWQAPFPQQITRHTLSENELGGFLSLDNKLLLERHIIVISGDVTKLGLPTHWSTYLETSHFLHINPDHPEINTDSALYYYLALTDLRVTLQSLSSKDESNLFLYTLITYILASLPKIANIGHITTEEQSHLFLTEAANLGHSAAQCKLGSYHQSKSFMSDREKAIEYYEMAAKQNTPEAFYILVSCYRYGFGVRQDFAKGLEYLERFISMTTEGFLFYEALSEYDLIAHDHLIGMNHKITLEKAYAMLKLIRQKSRPSSRVYQTSSLRLAKLYKHGKTDGNFSITQDLQKAFSFYEEVSKYQYDSYPAVLWKLARCYKEGLGTQRNTKEAINLLHKVAEYESILNSYFKKIRGAASFQLGEFYERGYVDNDINQPIDVKKASHYYQKAVDLGHDETKTRLKALLSKEAKIATVS